MKTFRIVACGMAVAAMTWLGARTAHAEESPVAGWGTRVNTGDNAGSVTLGVVFGTPGTMVIVR